MVSATRSGRATQCEQTVRRIRALDWTRVAADLNADGAALTGPIVTAAACDDLRGLYANSAPFRSRVDMRRHGFGKGEYKYFDYPLPDLVQTLRAEMYPRLAAVANGWMAALGRDQRYPESLAGMLNECRVAGQMRPTPLLLKYGPGDFNCLHQDLYGKVAFPIQLVVLLDKPGEDFTGGEFVLTEQRPRMQSRAEILPLSKGDGAVFAVSERPQQGTRGYYRVKMRHGVSRVRLGARHAVGIIFHDAA